MNSEEAMEDFIVASDSSYPLAGEEALQKFPRAFCVFWTKLADCVFAKLERKVSDGDDPDFLREYVIEPYTELSSTALRPVRHSSVMALLGIATACVRLSNKIDKEVEKTERVKSGQGKDEGFTVISYGASRGKN